MSSTSTLPPARAVTPARVLAISCVATFVAFLDVSVVNVAFPDMRDSFPSTSLPTLSWVISGYAVFFAALLTPAGRYADVLGRRRVFLVALAGFTLASALCAAAPTVELLIVARAVQGLAAGGMIPSAMGLVLAAFPAERRVAAIGVWGAAGSAAAAAGPALGGLLVSAFDWRAVFVINLPIGLAALLLGRRWLPAVPVGPTRSPDPVGVAAVTIGVALAVAGLTQGSEWGWTSAGFLACVLVGAGLLTLGMVRSLRHPAPAVETALWRDRTFAATNVASLFFGTSMFAWLLTGPLFVIVVWHYSVLEAGLSVTPGAFSAAIGAGIVGKSRHPNVLRLATVAGSLLFAGVTAVMALVIDERARFLTVWLPCGLVGGFAIGLVLTALASAAATSVPPEKFATGVGLSLTARQLGGGLGTAALAAIIAGVGGGLLSGIRWVFVFCAIVAVVSTVAGLGIGRRNSG